jgi:hypothetical protein
LGAIGEGGEPEDACAAIATSRLACSYSAVLCECAAEAEPESEINEISFATEGERVTVGDGDRASVGSDCVSDDTLTIVFDTYGPEGWRSWVLTRP